LDKWKEFIELLKKAGFDVEIPEIPGLTQQSDEVWDLRKYSDWLYKIIGDRKVILMGHSNGGRIAAYFTVSHPEKITKLILIDSAGIYHKDLHLQIKRFVFGNVAKMGKKITQSKVLKKFLYKLAGEKDYQIATPSMKQSMINLISVDLTNEFKQIDTETIIVWGEGDRITPLTDAKLINRLIKNSRLNIIPGARHSPFFTHPQKVLETLQNDL